MNVLLLRNFPFMIRWDALSEHKHELIVVANSSFPDPLECTVRL
jgi:hypothetical protein